jgi:hypothetical protein
MPFEEVLRFREGDERGIVSGSEQATILGIYIGVHRPKHLVALTSEIFLFSRIN